MGSAGLDWERDIHSLQGKYTTTSSTKEENIEGIVHRVQNQKFIPIAQSLEWGKAQTGAHMESGMEENADGIT